ncbi:MAG: hypothetical protein K8H88_04495 [Sandaracinaceae bacterium]|nr:hypothetical protein [Sandaracinaceae bacterium]
MGSWHHLCRAPDLALEDDGVLVRFETGRSHRVRVAETESTFEMAAMVARAARVLDSERLPETIWRRNRASQLVSFKTDRRGRVVATAWCPKAGLTAEEFQLVLRKLASESDRFEYLLTGRDLE